MLLDYHRFGGKSAEPAALANVLAHHGVVSPASGRPLSEELILGIGGGVACGYALYRLCGQAFVAIGTRAHWESTRSDFLVLACRRLGVPCDVRESGGAKVARQHLDEALAAGRPAIAAIGIGALPYRALTDEWARALMGVVVVFGVHEPSRTVHLGDRGPRPFTASLEELEDARGAIGSLKRRLIVPRPPTRPLDLAKAVRDGLKSCLQSLTKGKTANVGLASLAKWAGLVANPKDAKGWPKATSKPVQRFDALLSVYHAIETDGTGGRAHRTMYADFLDEAADLIDAPGLREAAHAYRDCGRAWAAVARAALPDSVPALAQARTLLDRREQLFVTRGPDASAERRKLWDDLRAIRAESPAFLPTKGDASIAHLREMRARIEDLRRAETEACETLKSGMTPAA